MKDVKARGEAFSPQKITSSTSEKKKLLLYFHFNDCKKVFLF